MLDGSSTTTSRHAALAIGVPPMAVMLIKKLAFPEKLLAQN
jgi:hypothetical protein